MTEKTQPTIEDLKAPLLAAVGAADLALATVNEIVASLRERAEDARTDAEARVEEGRARLTRLQEDLPAQFDELRDRFTSDELRKAAEGYADQATATYNKLVERGEAALERLRNQPALEEAASRVEGYTDQVTELTQDALGTVASQTRAVGERAAKLVGVELPKKTEQAVTKSEPAAAPAKKAPAKKAAPATAAKKAAPAKKTTAAPAKKVTQK
ncbi:heparin-binding hemagglutinin [Mycobacterium sp. CnD-18-1]|uniref:heparin-binding hemagglutinin n=1 Tax=Mycobacterium sp. CnD-18-1 TaxID=2917744 RepID=UPI001EF1A228|nr:heparin-binding hemagglutinin [Mycobacterium sp. CnD-18-1]MCG7608477.1 heparin-binding hemagglutinin [Mycobacterium sp. CnD-18-1]